MPESKCNYCNRPFRGETEEELMVKEREHYQDSVEEVRTCWGSIVKFHVCSTFDLVGEKYTTRVYAGKYWHKYVWGNEVASGKTSDIG